MLERVKGVICKWVLLYFENLGPSSYYQWNGFIMTRKTIISNGTPPQKWIIHKLEGMNCQGQLLWSGQSSALSFVSMLSCNWH